MLRLFESNEVNAPQALPGGPGVPQPLPQSGSSWDQDQVFAKRLFSHTHKTCIQLNSMHFCVFSYIPNCIILRKTSLETGSTSFNFFFSSLCHFFLRYHSMQISLDIVRNRNSTQNIHIIMFIKTK